jgi:hypothetical protein
MAASATQTSSLDMAYEYCICCIVFAICVSCSVLHSEHWETLGGVLSFQQALQCVERSAFDGNACMLNSPLGVAAGPGELELATPGQALH